MISKAVEREIKRLLERGELFQREIAERLGVSRQRVTRLHKERPIGMEKATEGEPGNCLVETEEEVIGGKKNRCFSCGALVYGECYECRLKKAKKNGELAQGYVGSGKLLDLDLSNEDAERLKELREAMQVRGDLVEEDEV